MESTDNDNEQVTIESRKEIGRRHLESIVVAAIVSIDMITIQKTHCNTIGGIVEQKTRLLQDADGSADRIVAVDAIRGSSRIAACRRCRKSRCHDTCRRFMMPRRRRRWREGGGRARKSRIADSHDFRLQLVAHRF